MRLVYDCLEIVKSTVIGMNSVVVGHVILVIGGRGMYGHKPYSVEAHFLDVVELGGNAVEVADTVIVGVEEAIDEYLIPIAVVIVYNIEGNLVTVTVVVILLTGR
jgi:hypothetical protein